MLGLGVDLIEIERIRRVRERHGARFLEKVFTDQELDYCLAKTDPAPSLAARWAAKEAAAKALGVGLGAELRFRDIAVLRDARGRPELHLSERAQERFGNARFLVSLSHHETTAVAVVAYLGEAEAPPAPGRSAVSKKATEDR